MNGRPHLGNTPLWSTTAITTITYFPIRLPLSLKSSSPADEASNGPWNVMTTQIHCTFSHLCSVILCIIIVSYIQSVLSIWFYRSLCLSCKELRGYMPCGLKPFSCLVINASPVCCLTPGWPLSAPVIDTVQFTLSKFLDQLKTWKRTEVNPWSFRPIMILIRLVVNNLI